ncbi:hypothetical protein, partial [Bacillus smithii]|uniref:hypothetical protein n=1 Tax=Bacillus smithii TaxID=1479 RepID=UPI002E20FBE4|nr:hypothetical protein [Bacillus smithii]
QNNLHHLFPSSFSQVKDIKNRVGYFNHIKLKGPLLHSVQSQKNGFCFILLHKINETKADSYR